MFKKTALITLATLITAAPAFAKYEPNETLYDSVKISKEGVLTSKARYFAIPNKVKLVSNGNGVVTVYIKDSPKEERLPSRLKEIKEFSLDLTPFLKNQNYSGSSLVIGNKIVYGSTVK